jgi:hypothetical protein
MFDPSFCIMSLTRCHLVLLFMHHRNSNATQSLAPVPEVYWKQTLPSETIGHGRAGPCCSHILCYLLISL